MNVTKKKAFLYIRMLCSIFCRQILGSKLILQIINNDDIYISNISTSDACSQ